MPQRHAASLTTLFLALLLSLCAQAQPLDLPAVLAQAAESNPTLQAAYAEVRMADAEVRQANLLPNPQLEARLLWPSSGSAAGPAQEYTLSYNLIDLFARGGRRSVAELRRDAALGQTLGQALEIEAQLKKAFYTVQGHAQALAEQKVLVDIAELDTELASRQRAAGNIPAIELAERKARLLQTRTQFYDRQMALFEARQELARLMGQAERPEGVVIEPRLADLPENDQQTAPGLLAEAMTERPDLAAQAYELQALQADRKLQNFLVFDGTTLAYVYDREISSVPSQGAEISLPLPIFDRRQGAKDRLAAELTRQRARQSELTQQVVTDVKTSLVRMANARLRVQQLEQLVPLREEILKLSQREYNAMLIGTNQLLDMRGQGSQAVLTLADAKADYWRARTELERTLGRSVLQDSAPFKYHQAKDSKP